MAYLASSLSLKKTNQLPLQQFNSSWFLSLTDSGAKLLKNQCLHRGARLITAPSNDQMVVCPLHRWTYDRAGNLQGTYIKNIVDCQLPSQRVYEWNNLLFSDEPIGVQKIKEQLSPQLLDRLVLDGYEHTSTLVDVVDADWRIFMEVYLDLYHVKPFHDGLGNFVDMDNFVWHEGDFWSLQEVGLSRTLGKNPSASFRALEEKIKANYPDEKHGALWFAIYPNIMIEVHPQTIIISTAWPNPVEPAKCINVIEFHHSEEVVAFDPEFVELQVAAYMETAAEDAEIARRIQLGRTGSDASAFPHHPDLEAGIAHFYAHVSRMPNHLIAPTKHW